MKELICLLKRKILQELFSLEKLVWKALLIRKKRCSYWKSEIVEEDRTAHNQISSKRRWIFQRCGPYLDLGLPALCSGRDGGSGLTPSFVAPSKSLSFIISLVYLHLWLLWCLIVSEKRTLTTLLMMKESGGWSCGYLLHMLYPLCLWLHQLAYWYKTHWENLVLQLGQELQVFCNVCSS